MGRRTWIKIYCDKWLRGSIREESPETRAIWIDILSLAGDSAYGDDGVISVAPSCGYTDQQISKILKISVQLWKKTKQKLQKTERISNNKSGEIVITNWKSYQSEYARQKPHREPEFMKLREEIQERDNYICQNCYKNKEELRVPLCIHHIDNNPQNNNKDNLITLCMPCHSHLLKKAVHKTKEVQRQSQESIFKDKVQQKSSKEKREERREKREKEERKKEYKYSGDDMELIKILKTHILSINPDHIFRGKDWNEKSAQQIRLMREQDKREIKDIKLVVDFAFKDSFWSGIIQSANSLRRNYDTMKGQIRTRGTGESPSQKRLRELKEEERENDRE